MRLTQSARFARAARSDRLRGFGSGWLVSIALHAAVLWVLGLTVNRAFSRVQPEPEEVVAHLDLRLVAGTPSGNDRASQPLPEAPAIARSEVPKSDVVDLVMLDEVLPRDAAIERALALDAATSAPSESAPDTLSSGRATVWSGGSGVHLPSRRASGHGTSDDPGSAPAAGRRGSADGDTVGALLPPVLKSGPEPDYPDAARRRGEQGDVRCRMQIDASGCVIAVEVIATSGSARLDEAARISLLGWRFRLLRRSCGDVPPHRSTLASLRRSLPGGPRNPGGPS
jgi:protein TonB